MHVDAGHSGTCWRLTVPWAGCWAPLESNNNWRLVSPAWVASAWTASLVSAGSGAGGFADASGPRTVNVVQTHRVM